MIPFPLHLPPDLAARSADGAVITLHLPPDAAGQALLTEILDENLAIIAAVLHRVVRVMRPEGHFGAALTVDAAGARVMTVACDPGAPDILRMALQAIVTVCHDGAGTAFIDALTATAPTNAALRPLLVAPVPVTCVSPGAEAIDPVRLGDYAGGRMALALPRDAIVGPALEEALFALAACSEQGCFQPFEGPECPDFVTPMLVEDRETGTVMAQLSPFGGTGAEVQAMVAMVWAALGTPAARAVVILSDDA